MEQGKKNENFYLAICAGVGLVFGVLFDQISIGLIFGVAIGLALDDKEK